MKGNRKQKDKVNSIFILDFGGQYAHLIGRRIREQKVYSKIVPGDIDYNSLQNIIDENSVKGLILSGGPSSVYEENAPKVDPDILEIDLPVLGICYGHQLLAQIMGGRVNYLYLTGSVR